MKRFNYVLISIIIIFYVITGCSKAVNSQESGGSYNDNPEELNETDYNAETLEPTVDTKDIESQNNTITVSYTVNSTSIVKEYAKKYMELHPGAVINVTSTSPGRNKTLLMAGKGLDIFDGMYGLSYKDVRDTSVLNLLTDFHPVMQADSDFNEDDYYTSVFDAMSFQNRLYFFPTQFSIIMMSANKNVSDEFIKKFSEYETVSLYDLFELRNTFPEAQKYMMYKNFNVRDPIMYEFKALVDIYNKTCDFNNQKFITLMTDTKAIAAEDSLYKGYNANGYSPLQEAEYSQKYLFQDVYSNVYQYMLSYEQSLFSKMIPITNSSGEALIQPNITFCISGNSKNKELAWDFIKFMISTKAHEDESSIPLLWNTPVSKSLVRYILEQQLPADYKYSEKHYNWKVESEEAELQIQNAIEWFESVCNMPMFNSWSDSIIEYGDSLDRFNNGQITAEQLASELQNKVSLKLME